VCVCVCVCVRARAFVCVTVCARVGVDLLFTHAHTPPPAPPPDLPSCSLSSVHHRTALRTPRYGHYFVIKCSLSLSPTGKNPNCFACLGKNYAARMAAVTLLALTQRHSAVTLLALTRALVPPSFELIGKKAKTAGWTLGPVALPPVPSAPLASCFSLVGYSPAAEQRWQSRAETQQSRAAELSGGAGKWC